MVRCCHVTAVPPLIGSAAQDASLADFSAGATIGVCLRQRLVGQVSRDWWTQCSSLIGQGWGPWQFFTGTVVRAFRVNNVFPSNTFLGVGAVCR